MTRHPPVTLREIPRRFRIHERRRSARVTGQVFLGGPERLERVITGQCSLSRLQFTPIISPAQPGSRRNCRLCGLLGVINRQLRKQQRPGVDVVKRRNLWPLC